MPLVLITGGGRRLGLGLALLFADKEWDVIIHYHNTFKGAIETKRKILEKKRLCEIFYADLRYSSNIELMFKQIKQLGLVPNVLINNAGIFPERRTLTELSVEQWDEVMDINLRSALLVSKEFASLAQNGSRIINIASLGGIQIWKDRIDYNVSKSALIQLSNALARALAPKITVNTVCPGYIDIQYDMENDYQKNKVSLDKIPMQKFGKIQDVFDAVYFFSTCSDFITGQVILVDGGQHLIN